MKNKADKVDSGLSLTYAGGTQRVVSNYGNKKCLSFVTKNSFMTFTVVLSRLSILLSSCVVKSSNNKPVCSVTNLALVIEAP